MCVTVVCVCVGDTQQKIEIRANSQPEKERERESERREKIWGERSKHACFDIELARQISWALRNPNWLRMISSGKSLKQAISYSTSYSTTPPFFVFVCLFVFLNGLSLPPPVLSFWTLRGWEQVHSPSLSPTFRIRLSKKKKKPKNNFPSKRTLKHFTLKNPRKKK